MSYSYDDIYPLYAWRDNRRRLVLTQGEGYSGTLSGTYMVKAPRFQLMDEQGVIEIPSSGSPRIQLAVTRPNCTEDLLSCNIEDREQGIISCPITKSMTDIAGEVKGEIRLILGNTVIKFYGIDFFVYDGVSDEAAAQSSQFSDLIQALQQVSAIIEGGSSGTISLDTVIQHGGTKPAASGIIYDYLVNNYVPKTTQIAGLDLQDDITASELRTALNVPQVYERTRRPDDGDGERIGQFWVAKLTDSTTNKITYEIYQLYEYYTIESAPTVVHHRWKKICDIDQVVSKDTQIAGVEIQDGISLGDLLTAILSTNITATTNQPVAGRTIFQYLLNNYVGFKTTLNPDSAKDGHTLYIDSTHGNDLLFVVPTNNKITQYQICADGTIKSRYCVATSGVQTGSWQGWVALVSTNNIQDSAVTTPKINDSAVTTPKINDGAVTEDKLASNSVTTSKIKDGEITPSKLDRQYEKVISCSGNEIDTANDSQAIYIHHANGGFKGIVFFTGYNNYAGVTTVKQFRLCKDGKVEYRTGTVVTPTTTPNTYTWDKAYDENWNPIGSTQNLQDGAVTLDKLSSNVKDTIQEKALHSLDITLSTANWNNKVQNLTISQYEVTENTVVILNLSDTAFSQLDSCGCESISAEVQEVNNTPQVVITVEGETPTVNITIGLLLTEAIDLNSQIKFPFY